MVKTYRPLATNDGEEVMVESDESGKLVGKVDGPDTNYVTAEDYKALALKLDAARKEIEAIAIAIDKAVYDHASETHRFSREDFTTLVNAFGDPK